MIEIIFVFFGELFLLGVGIIFLFFPAEFYEHYCKHFGGSRLLRLNPIMRRYMADRTSAIQYNRFVGVISLTVGILLLVGVIHGWRSGLFPPR